MRNYAADLKRYSVLSAFYKTHGAVAITLWFHVHFPYGHAFLTPDGIAALKGGGSGFFTPEAAKRLADGGTAFLEQVQTKAEIASLFWTGGALFYAAFGGGALSLDRVLVKREF